MDNIMTIIAFVLMFIAGFLTGFGISMKVVSYKTVGSIKINNSDPEEPPYLFAEFNKNIDSVLKERYIILKVDIEDFSTQK